MKAPWTCFLHGMAPALTRKTGKRQPMILTYALRVSEFLLIRFNVRAFEDLF